MLPFLAAGTGVIVFLALWIFLVGTIMEKWQRRRYDS